MKQRIYRAKAVEWALAETSKGSEQIAVRFEITTPESEFNHITWYGYFTDKTFERTIESLRFCGWVDYDVSDIKGLDKNEVDLVIEDEENEQGAIHPKVRWVNRAGGLAIKAPLSGEKAKSFAASMRDKIKAMDAAAGTKPRPLAGQPPNIGAQDGPPPLTDKDLGF